MSIEVLILVVEFVLVFLGLFFMFVAAVGVLRLPDFYSRVHAPTKAATLGIFFLLLAVLVALPETVVATKAILALVFIGATAPVGAHILTRAAYRNGVPASPDTELDEYGPVVERRKWARTEPEHAADLDQS